MKYLPLWLKKITMFFGSSKRLDSNLDLSDAKADVVDYQEFSNMVVAEVIKYSKHPNADRLRVVELNIGNSVVALVVCGAFNFEAGDKVVLALPGAKIPHNQHDTEGQPFILAKATIRGIESQGMICSGKELGLSDDGSGIMVLKNSEQFLGQTYNSSMT